MIFRSVQEEKAKKQEEIHKLSKEKQELNTLMRIVEANMKAKTFVLETLKGRLSQFLLDLGDNSKKIKMERVKTEILAIQENFIKLKTEFEVQMKWLTSSLSQTNPNDPSNLLAQSASSLSKRNSAYQAEADRVSCPFVVVLL